MAYNPLNTNLVIAGSNGPVYAQTMHYSTNGGETWQVAGGLPQGNYCCDPTVGWSSDGSKAYAASLEWGGSSRVLVYRSGDNGQTWTDLVNEPGADSRREFGSGTDKEYLHVNVHSGSPCQDNIYVTWHERRVSAVPGTPPADRGGLPGGARPQPFREGRVPRDVRSFTMSGTAQPPGPGRAPEPSATSRPRPCGPSLRIRRTPAAQRSKESTEVRRG